MTAQGWYKDSKDERLARWHDGSRWTEHTMVMADWKGPGQPPPPQAAWSAPVASQGRQEARVDAASARARVKAMRPWWKRKRVIIPGVLVLLIIVIAASSSGGKKKDNVTASNSTGTTVHSVNASSSHPAADDAAMTSCENQGYGTVKVVVQFTNHTTKTSNYLADIEIKDASGTKVGDGGASTDNLAAGQTANIDGYGTAGSSTKGTVSCVITSVTRYASS